MKCSITADRLFSGWVCGVFGHCTKAVAAGLTDIFFDTEAEDLVSGVTFLWLVRDGCPVSE
jgi:hypothetical protein